MNAKETLLWSAFWIMLSLVFNTAIYFAYAHNWLGIGRDIGQQLGGKQAALQFFTGYLAEKSLSLGNTFVIAVIFAHFKGPGRCQHRVLFWGIVGAVVLRGARIVAGAALIARFKWLTYLLGGVLIATAVKMLVTRHEKMPPEKNSFVRLVRRRYGVSPDYAGGHFFTRLNEPRAITSLFVMLLVIERTEVVFAIDSIPAIFA